MNKVPQILLRPVAADDLDMFFDHQCDPHANHMAAFTAENPHDRAAFDGKWESLLSDDRVLVRTITINGETAGHIGHFIQLGKPAISYWLGRSYWGKGVATCALEAFLPMIAARPLYARAVKDNAASLRVLEKCGFKIVGQDRPLANARGHEVEELVLVLSKPDFNRKAPEEVQR